MNRYKRAIHKPLRRHDLLPMIVCQMFLKTKVLSNGRQQKDQSPEDRDLIRFLATN